jgi:uncharacterized Tic20 family protein
LISDVITYGEYFDDRPPINFIMGMIVVGVILIVELILEFILIILASVKASSGQDFKYPLTIKFIT